MTATGEVRMNREGYNLRADSVSWNRGTGEVRAEGGVRITNPGGDVAYARFRQCSRTRCATGSSRICCSSSPTAGGWRRSRRPGATASPPSTAPLTPPARWSRRTAARRTRPGRSTRSGSSTIRSATASPMRARPSTCSAWRSSACPACRIRTASQGGGTGLLVPEIRYSRRNGVELSAPYYIRLAPNRDVTITPHVYTKRAADARGRISPAELDSAPSRSAAYVTHGSRLPLNPQVGAAEDDEGLRAYIEGDGRFVLSPRWTVTAFGRYVTDRTFMRRYDISRDDRLRSFVNAERISADSYISIAGWAFEGLRVTDVDGMQPIALPAIDARWRIADPWLGGRIELQANSLAILRTEGQDSQRAFAAARWDRRMITGLGQELVLTAYARGDLYHASDTSLTQTISYRGREGWSGALHRRARRRPALAVRRRIPGRHPPVHAAPPVRRLAADRESGHPQRGCALGRPRGFEPVRAEPLPRLRPLGGRRAGHLRRRLGGRSAQRLLPHHDRPELPARPAADDPAAGHRPVRPLLRPCRPHRPRVRPHRQPHPPLPHRQGQPRAPPQRDRRGDRRPPDLCDDRLSAARPQHRSRRSRICATARRSGSAAGSGSAASGRSSDRR